MPHRSSRAMLAASLALATLGWNARARGEDAQVQIETNDPHLEVLDRTNQVAMVPTPVGHFGTTLVRSPVYASLCATTPCAKDLSIGDHWLALSTPGGKVIEGDAPVPIHGPARVHGKLVDRSGARELGWIVFIASVLSAASRLARHHAEICRICS